MLQFKIMTPPVVDRFITPTPPLRVDSPSGETLVEDLVPDPAPNRSQERDSRVGEVSVEVAADRGQIAEARRDMEVANKDELAGMASRMMTAVMDNGEDYAIADKDLFWEVANEYFTRKDDFDLEAVTRLYLSASARGLSADNFDNKTFSDLVPMVNKRWEKERDFKKFVKRRCTRVSAHQAKTQFGNWFNNPDKGSYTNITNDSIGDALEDYQTEASQTDVEIWDKVKLQPHAPVEITEQTSFSDDTRRLSVASDAIELAAETLSTNVWLEPLPPPSFLESLKWGSVSAAVQEVLEKFFRDNYLTDFELQILRDYAEHTPGIQATVLQSLFS